MIIEHVHLNIKPDQTAKEIIYPMEGLNAVQLIKHVEDHHRYILMVFWDRIENHTEGFRKSMNRYQRLNIISHRCC